MDNSNKMKKYNNLDNDTIVSSHFFFIIPFVFVLLCFISSCYDCLSVTDHSTNEPIHLQGEGQDNSDNHQSGVWNLYTTITILMDVTFCHVWKFPIHFFLPFIALCSMHWIGMNLYYNN